MTRGLLVVRRGDLERLHRLKRKFDGLPIDILVDRRSDDRRWLQAAWPVERRRKDRRASWPSRFPSSPFVVVPGALVDDWVVPARGDALVSRLDGAEDVRDYGLSVIPGEVQSRYDAYDPAVEQAKRFARYSSADLWYTEDEVTFVLLEIFREPPQGPGT